MEALKARKCHQAAGSGAARNVGVLPNLAKGLYGDP